MDHINMSYENGNVIATVGEERIEITPNIMAESWGLYNDRDALRHIYLYLRKDHDHVDIIYDTISQEKDTSKIILLVSCLLSIYIDTY